MSMVNGEYIRMGNEYNKHLKFCNFDIYSYLCGVMLDSYQA